MAEQTVTTLTITLFEGGTPREFDYEHILNMLRQGFHSGELVCDAEGNEHGWWSITTVGDDD